MEQFSKITGPFACATARALLVRRSPLRSSPGPRVLGSASRPKRLAVRFFGTANVVETAATRRWLFRAADRPLFAGSTGLTRKLSS